MEKVKRNYIFYTFSQIVLLCFSVFTFPYVSKTLGVDNYGVYCYFYAILSYFLIFAKLGILNYGVREVAECKKSKKKLTNKFLEIYLVQFILTGMVLLIYLLFSFIFYRDKLSFVVIYSIFLVANFFDIAWFFQGVQDFFSITIRNLFINVFSIILIFIFVKTKNDVITYLLIVSFAQVIGNVVVWWRLKNIIVINKIKIKFDLKKFIKHLKGMLLLFIPILTVNIYNLMDEIMLGNLSVYGQVGIYACAKKIIWIPLAVVTPLSMVLFPYISERKSQNNDVDTNIKVNNLVFVTWLSTACSVGLFYVVPYIINIFLGIEYIEAINVVRVMCIYLFFNILSLFLRDVYYLPNHKDKMYITTVLIGIPINLVLNFIFIPKFNSLGAALATAISEFLLCLVRLFLIKEEIDIIYFMRKSLYFLGCALLMVYLADFINFNNSLVVELIIKVIFCVLIYLFFSFYYLKDLFQKKG